ncbi:MAG: DNA adenine methylase [Acidobacteria bacterium]|nr:DNA adenine methylase [Acidobacteriota bacterium]
MRQSFQPELRFPDLHHAVVNVAAVPQRSPFRYPGGKTWLVPKIRQWLKKRPDEFIEPFAGGGIISLTVAAENLAEHITMIEIDEQVAAVWQTILTDGKGEWLADRIATFDLTPESLHNALAVKATSIQEQAFQTILKNRTFHGGILAAGSAPLKHGENGKGIKSRWYAETLKKRILAIGEICQRLHFIQGDGIEIIKTNLKRRNTAFFIDPPYTASGKKAGKRLYTHHEVKHEELFGLVAAVQGDFLMTYDDAESIRELSRKHGFDTQVVAMKNTHHAELKELLIGKNLDWARGTVMQSA